MHSTDIQFYCDDRDAVYVNSGGAPLWRKKQPYMDSLASGPVFFCS